MKKTINIANDFSRYPYGRSRKYSSSSGEEFREKFLVPALRDTEIEKINIVLDGAEGYGSSFLDEAFANLVRISGFDKEFILQKLHFISKEDQSLIDEIKIYIKSV